jgi:hydrogenase maturation protease
MTWPCPIRVVGVGSPLGDDALAWEVVRDLRERQALRPEIEFYMVEGGQRILDVLDGRGTLLLVDAVGTSTRPGAIHRFEWPHQCVEALRPGSTHDLRPAEALRLAAVLGIAPLQVIVFGIEIETIDPHSGLSQSVRAAVPELVRRLVDELKVSATMEGNASDPSA